MKTKLAMATIAIVFAASTAFAGFLNVGGTSAPPAAPAAETTVVETDNGSTVKVTVESIQRNKGGVTVYEDTPDAASVIEAINQPQIEELKTEALLLGTVDSPEMHRELSSADRKLIEKELQNINANIAVTQAAIQAADSIAEKVELQNSLDQYNRRAIQLTNKLGTVKMKKVPGNGPSMNDLILFGVLCILAYLFAVKWLIPWLSRFGKWFASLRIVKSGSGRSRNRRSRNRQDQEDGSEEGDAHQAPA